MATHRPTPGEVRVLLAENRALLRIGMLEVLTRAADIRVLGEAYDLAGVGSEIERHVPEVVVVGSLADCPEPGEATRKVAMSCPVPAPRLLTVAGVRDGEPHLDGTAGTLAIDARPEQLAAAVHMVSAGYSFFTAADGADPPARPVSGRPADPSHLTRRESDVLLLLARGRTNAEISAQLVLTESTVKTHVQSLLRKLRLRRRIDAAIYAYERGLVQVGAEPAGLLGRPGSVVRA